MVTPPSQSAVPGHVVTAAANGDEQFVLSREVHRIDHIRDAGAHRDEPRTLAMHAVPDARGAFVAIRPRLKQRAAQSPPQRLDGIECDRSFGIIQTGERGRVHQMSCRPRGPAMP
jgi:hypothetical protein